MRKVEIFSDSDHQRLQDKINDWFREHSRVIVDGYAQSEVILTQAWLTISIFYNEVSDGDNARTD